MLLFHRLGSGEEEDVAGDSHRAPHYIGVTKRQCRAFLVMNGRFCPSIRLEITDLEFLGGRSAEISPSDLWQLRG